MRPEVGARGAGSAPEEFAGLLVFLLTEPDVAQSGEPSGVRRLLGQRRRIVGLGGAQTILGTVGEQVPQAAQDLRVRHRLRLRLRRDGKLAEAQDVIAEPALPDIPGELRQKLRTARPEALAERFVRRLAPLEEAKDRGLKLFREKKWRYSWCTIGRGSSFQAVESAM